MNYGNESFRDARQCQNYSKEKTTTVKLRTNIMKGKFEKKINKLVVIERKKCFFSANVQ